ncbi:hypothetical protein COCON_G00174220 [Conger conger]|uniref:Uncharacterized protein n=1 Tax=Conger conger TaxID=82655 RepID=A0A9Q1D490_CONCO|nr:hypothetical protein COCON_G00174220 [Conger conger]
MFFTGPMPKSDKSPRCSLTETALPPPRPKPPSPHPSSSQDASQVPNRVLSREVQTQNVTQSREEDGSPAGSSSEAKAGAGREQGARLAGSFGDSPAPVPVGGRWIAGGSLRSSGARRASRKLSPPAHRQPPRRGFAPHTFAEIHAGSFAEKAPVAVRGVMQTWDELAPGISWLPSVQKKTTTDTAAVRAEPGRGPGAERGDGSPGLPVTYISTSAPLCPRRFQDKRLTRPVPITLGQLRNQSQTEHSQRAENWARARN